MRPLDRGWGGRLSGGSRMRSMIEALLSQAMLSVRQSRTAGRRPSRSASLVLPTQAEDCKAFAVRANNLLRDRRTYVYIDTSFLMSMMRTGRAARIELISWLEVVCGARLSVPSWAAHELYRHHVEKTIPNELKDKLDELEKVAQKSFHLLWPLLEEPLAGAPSARAQRNEARDALRALRGVVARARNWSAGYDVHAADVIAFANSHALQNSDVFEYLQTVEPLSQARFTGRVPPGFKDKHKREVTQQVDDGDGEDGALIGSNRWGDLMFWQEILGDAKARRANAIVILTRDVKNDWRMGGTLPVGEPASSAIGEQPAHPTLVFEAARQAGVRELLLLDQKRIAAIFDALNLSGGSAFVAATQPPPAITPKTEAERRAEEIERTTEERSAVRARDARSLGIRFLDRAGLTVTEPKLRRALVESISTKSGSISGVAELERVVERVVANGDSIETVITGENLAELDHIGLVAFARRLGIAALERPALESSISDLVGLFNTLPPATAGCFFLGLLAAMYVEADSNTLKPSPASPVAQQLFGFQSSEFAALPIAVLGKQASRADRLPLYLPDATAPPITVRMETDTDLEAPGVLRALWVGEQQLLTSAQGIEALKLSTRFGGNPVTPELILDHLAELYALPRLQLVAETGVRTAFNLQDFWGFKAPRDIWADPTEELHG